MNSRQLHYAILLSKVRNFSQVAEKLNISQPALSKQISALESEMGVKLFDRSSIPLTLTPAGEHFVAEAEELLYKESQLIKSMELFQSGEAGTLTIGTTPFRSAYLVEDTIGKVRKKFQGIRIHLCEEGGDLVRKDAAEGKFDLAIVNLPVDDSVLEVHPLEADRLVLVLSEAMAHSFGFSGDKICFEDCKALPFVVVGTGQEMRQLFDKLCARGNFTPVIAVETVNLTTSWSIARAGIAATLLPQQFVTQMPMDGMKMFELVDAPYIRRPVVVTRRDQVMTPAAKYALELMTGKTTAE